LVLNLRSRLVGTRVTNVEVLNQDRVVEIRFSGELNTYFLIFELTGSSANLFFIDGDLRIISTYHPVSATERSQRLLLPGSRYLPPQKKTWSRTPQKDLPDASCPPNRSAEEYYEHLVEEQRFASLRIEISSALKKAIARTERRQTALIQDLRSVEDAEDFRKKGDLVLANLQRLRTGMENADLVGYDGTHTPVPLDPKRTPPQNAEMYFKKYKKAKTGEPLIKNRLKQTAGELAFLRLQEAELQNATDADVLHTIRENLIERGYLDQPASVNRRTVPKAMTGVRKIIYQGWEFIIGKSAAGNDHVTQKLARPDDLWLHAEGLPGSHVLVKNPRRIDIPYEIILYAASLAARYSKGKQAAKVPVTYTLARYVSKPKGSKPGLVVLTQRKTVMVKPAAEGPI
jgi:predicted ribosome quality control (RQC) complex YloA/Tae2 family protein